MSSAQVSSAPVGLCWRCTCWRCTCWRCTCWRCTCYPSPASPSSGLAQREGLIGRLARDKVALVAAVTLTLVVLAAIAAPLISPYDPYFTDLTKSMQPPSAEHWFGTDNTGRDILSRVLYGTRNTLFLGLAGVFIGGAIGGVLGILAAFYRKFDPWVMRLVDIMLAFPAILIGLAVAAIVGSGLGSVVIALVVSTIPTSPASRADRRLVSWAWSSWRPGERSAYRIAR